MKKTQLLLAAGIALGLVFTGNADILFPKKTLYNVRFASSVALKAEAFKNIITISREGKSFVQLELSLGPTTPLPPPPKPCNPGRCYPLIFSLDNEKYVVTIEKTKSALQVKALRGDKEFRDMILKSPGKQLALTDPKFQ